MAASIKPLVLKFGGTSVEDADAVGRLCRIVRAHAGKRPVVVVSAMSHVTDALLAATRTASEGHADEALSSLEPHIGRHLEVAHGFASPERRERVAAALRRTHFAVGELLRDLEVAAGADSLPRLCDAVVSQGELLSARLIACALEDAGLPARDVDARRVIVTDERGGRATPMVSLTERRTRAQIGPLLEAGQVPVLGGFVAATEAGLTTTLGRGGSDFTAALVGAALGAREIQIWTDVSGMMTADPRVIAHAHPVARLTYAEAAELAFYGAKVLHPKTILPAVVRGIPVHIRNSREPDAPGTQIHFDAEQAPQTVKAIAHKTGVQIVHVTSARMLGAYGFMRAIFEVFERHAVAVDVVTTSEVSVSISLKDAEGLDELVADLEKIGAVRVESNRATVSVVGEGLRATPGVAGRIFDAIRDINVLLISQGASSTNVTFAVDGGDAEETVRRLHAEFFERDESSANPAT